MDLTYIGHQSWMVHAGKHRILIDPILQTSFGSTEYLQFEIVPRRRVDLLAAPCPSAVILTTEHLQHFQPRSFKAMRELDWCPPVFVHRLFPACAVEILIGLGFSVKRLANGENVQSGPVAFALFTNPDAVPPWDSRVASIGISDGRHCIGIQSSTIPSKKLANWLSASGSALVALIASNNSFTVRTGTGIGLSNILPIKLRTDCGAVGVHSLIASLLEPFKGFHIAANLLMVGAGYRDARRVMPPPLWTNSTLAKLADQLSLGTRVHCPLPGQCSELAEEMRWREVEWISLLPEPLPEIDEFADDPWRITQLFCDSSLDTIQEEHLNEALKNLGQAAILSPLGKVLARTNQYLGRWLNGRRFVLQLMEKSGGRDYALDLTDARFHEVVHEGDEALRRYPFGVRVPRSDFRALLEGRIQIWELSMACARQWYVAPRAVSPMAFFYSYFAESVQQDLALTNYSQELRL